MSGLSSPLVSVVILNYNGQDYIVNCVDSVLRNQYTNFEVILVDNASTDRSLKVIQQSFLGNPKVQIIKTPKNLGFSGGNNIGFDHASGKYVLFLNNDTVVPSNWLSVLVDALERDPQIGVAQSVICSIDGKQIQAAGLLFSNYLIKKHMLFKDQDSSVDFKPVFEVSFACGASLIIRREILEAMGAFDPALPFFYDDTLLSLKTVLAGKKAVTVSGSKIFHIGGAAGGWGEKIRYTTFHLLRANTALLFDVYYKKTDLLRALLSNGVYIFSNTFFNLYDRNVAAVLGNLEALAWSVRNFRYLWRNRLMHWSKSVVAPEELKRRFERISIPLAFYLLPSKLGSEIYAHAVGTYENTIIKR